MNKISADRIQLGRHSLEGLLLPWTPGFHYKENFSSVFQRKTRDGKLVAEVRRKYGGAAWTWEIIYPGAAGHEKRGTRAMRMADSILIHIGFSFIPERLIIMV